MKELYIPIDIERISFYLSAGIIKPDKDFKKSIDDIQSKFKNIIIATSDKTLIGNSNCLILVVLEDSEYQSLDNVLYVINSIPISRIKYIYLKNREDIQNIISNITRSTPTAGGEAFVDESLFRDSPDLSTKMVNLPDNLPLESIKNDEFDYDKFNRLLGAMAFIQFNNYRQYNKEFFEELSSISNDVKNEFEKVTKLKMPKKEKNRLNYDLSQYKNLNYRDVIDGILEKNGKKFGDILSGDKLKAKYDILAFSKNKKENCQKEILNLYSVFYNISTCGEHISDECEKMSIDCLFIYGYNRGYDDLRSRYGNKIIKFNLNLYIDRLVIEAVYNFIKNPHMAENCQLNAIKKFDCHITTDGHNKNEFYLFDAKYPIEFDGFIRDLVNYKDNNDLIKKISKAYLEIKQEKRLLERTDEYIKKFEANSDKLTSGDMLKNLSELLTDTLKTIKDIPQNHQNIISNNRKFYTSIANIPEIKIENLELKDEIERLKDEIERLKK
ncbi:hypothetical protein [Campylobacter lanienae]|uniref:hypothetical protein n=1 Tax=Campylobacter lanienae TaxID=75658 RepID=UPI000BB41D2D|nr:hypothetical protein [Campylobacter lanienae]